jgi:hypothetical protein
MRQALAGVSKIAGDEYPPLSNRLGISVPFGWASEVIPEFHYHDDNVKEYVAFYIWPANTKQQGYSIFTRSLDWTKRETLPVAGKDYELEIYPLMMLRHFDHNVASLAFSETDLVKPLITPENFYDLTGKWHDDKWKEFEESLDEHFTPEFKWRDKCNWADNFTNTDRSYLTMSLGFTVGVWIPFSTFKAIDKTETDIAQVSAFVAEIVKSFKGLIPSQ